MAHRTIEQIESLIGDRLRAYRLDRNLPQDVVASKAGISRGVLQRLENGGGTSLRTFIAVLKALQLEDWFDTVAPVAAVNPLLMVEEQPRRRARRKGPSHG